MQHSNNHVDKILASLDGMQRANAKPFMHTRVLARLQEENSFWAHAVSFLTKPIIAFCCLAGIVVANVYTVIDADKNAVAEEEQTISPGAFADVMHNDNYILAVNDINP